MHQTMPIPNLVGVMVEAWNNAEEATLQQLADKHWDSDEEFVTALFRGEFRGSVLEMADNNSVQIAFLEDLYSYLPGFRGNPDLASLAASLSATTTFHPREVEGNTGGDLGIVFLRPSVELMPGGSTLEIQEDYPRGILCQAKITSRSRSKGSGCWGSFTKSQRKVLSERTSYLALLLYRYLDECRQRMAPFRWQACEDVPIAEIERWLKEDSFPDLWSSQAVLEGLADCTIGTDEPATIKDLIAPKVRGALVVRVGWGSDDPPPSTVELGRTERLHQAQVQYR